MTDNVIETETCGQLPSTIYAIKTVQRDKEGHRRTTIELFSKKSNADYYAERALGWLADGTWKEVKVSFWSSEMQWEEAKIE